MPTTAPGLHEGPLVERSLLLLIFVPNSSKVSLLSLVNARRPSNISLGDVFSRAPVDFVGSTGPLDQGGYFIINGPHAFI